jgi:serine/threonine-protein kinase
MTEPLILDRYRLIERLALGGSAEVWRGHDEQLDRPVAIKRLHPHLMPDVGSRKRLAAEARAAAGLSHPVIVGVYDVDAEGDAPALIMELVEGESLAARIERDGPLPVAEAVAVTADVADALFHAHQQGVIHRDVKPGNVLLARDGRTRLVDFGIAHSLAASAERLTLTGTVIGTLRAMAPEQLAAGPMTPRTDLYGLGVILHEALTGNPPYASPSPVALADAQRAGPPPLDGIDPALADLVRACLAYDPDDRPLHAAALAAALRAWRSGAPTDVHAVPIAAASGADTSALTRPVPVPAPRPASAHRSTRRGFPLALAALAALVIAVVVGAVILSGIGVADPDVGVDASPTASATPVVPTTTPIPAWLAELVAEVAQDCGDAAATEVEPQLAALSEDEAEDAVDELTDACGEDRPGRGRGRGNGGNNGNGNDD